MEFHIKNKDNMDDDQAKRFAENVKRWRVHTGEDPNVHGTTPFSIFDPGPGDPWRELHLVDSDGKQVTSLGPLEDPTEMTLGNALFIMECCNNYKTVCADRIVALQKCKQLERENEDLRMTVGQLECLVDKMRPARRIAHTSDGKVWYEENHC